ncbi:AraC family transcriptional regulator [Ramlibacter humi]|nr:AraC family transcriptional regulator [Ramlibacter humi]
MDNATPLAPLPRNLLDAIRDAGVDPASLARRLGIEPASLETGVSFADVDRFMLAAWEALADPAFGLKAGSRLRPERFGIVGIAAMSSPDLGTALKRKARYNRLVWGDVYEVDRRGDRATIRVACVLPPRPYAQARIDMELASLLTFSRLVTGREVTPVAVTVRQAAPAYRRLYGETFGCPVTFEAEDDSLVLRASDLDLPLVSANSSVGAALVAAAEAHLGRMVAPVEEDGFRPRAAQAVRRLLRGSEPTLDAVADQLHMSSRTVQRRLAEHGLSFTALLDEARRESALDYLRGHSVTAEEIAFLLGFATPSSFFRAFKRWTGRTPEAWRREMRLRPA